ncbi:50S ribosomal protein L3 N(5)-glutamine methyltransferase [Porticoccaceae bacterium]|nr:50S ribosomal protein L3 N(5)-glutamine methyltransferase [Porticoccaceae bacterium]MDB2594670.1 50S ribosomal protein L3 N(5)-glutamine methyltransferase [Porticoccaceae bacterium]
MTEITTTPDILAPVTVATMLEQGQQQFETAQIYFGHGTTSAWDEAVYLLSHVLDLPPDADRSLLSQVLTDQQQADIQALYQRRVSERIPAPYLTGTAWFCGLPFKVDKRVIIPRSPLAELVYNGFQPWCETEPAKVLDLCTGSGCIGIACAYAFEQAHVVLSDISVDALAVAAVNIEQHEVGNRVRALQSDLFDGLSGQRFDLIVSNPPYVDAVDLADMPDEYQHEPELALASGDDGLDFTRRLLIEAEQYLIEEGVLVVEVGNSWVALERAFAKVPFVWLEFAEGDAGVFVLSRNQLLEHRESFV